MELNQPVAKDQEIEDNKRAVEVNSKSFDNYDSIKTTTKSNIEKSLTVGSSQKTFKKY